MLDRQIINRTIKSSQRECGAVRLILLMQRANHVEITAVHKSVPHLVPH